MTEPFSEFSRQICRDQRVAKLCRALEQHCFDGSELDYIVDSELHGLEHSVTAKTIKAAIARKYKDCIPRNIVIEIVAELLDEEEPT